MAGLPSPPVPPLLVAAAAASWSPLTRVPRALSPPRARYSQTHTVRCIPSARARRREPPALLLAAAVPLVLGRLLYPPARAHASPSPAAPLASPIPSHRGRGEQAAAAGTHSLGSLLPGPRASAHTRTHARTRGSLPRRPAPPPTRPRPGLPRPSHTGSLPPHPHPPPRESLPLRSSAEPPSAPGKTAAPARPPPPLRPSARSPGPPRPCDAPPRTAAQPTAASLLQKLLQRPLLLLSRP